jgi:hypothetical protein
VKGTIRKIRAAGAGFVGLIGVQSNQYPRALDLARLFRAAGLPVSDRRLPRVGLHLDAARVARRPAGRARHGRHACSPAKAKAAWPILLRDIAAGTQQPLYNFLSDLPGLEEATIPVPAEPHDQAHRRALHQLRCRTRLPYQCSFCTIINVQGRKSRYRSPTTSSRSCARTWRRASRASSSPTTISRATALGTDLRPADSNCARARSFRSSCSFQVDTLCHRIPRFIEKAARAGCTSVFIGSRASTPNR